MSEETDKLRERVKAARAHTKKEARAALYRHLTALVRHIKADTKTSEEQKMNLLLFSVLCIFDGVAAEFPAMDIVVSPHELDEQFQKERGERWFKPGMVLNDDCEMHAEFAKAVSM